jgi:hypothetical protein
MNRTPNVERVLREYLADDGTSAPDYVLDVVADRISGTRQRRSWPLPWRLQMNTYTKLAAAAVIAAIAVGVIYLNLPGRNDVGVSTPTPTPRPSATLYTGQLTEGTLVAGHYTMTLPIDEAPSLTIAADVPAGWQGLPDIPGLVSQTDGILIGFMVTDGLFGDPCHWDLDGTGLDQPGDVVVGPTVDDLVAALRANASYTSSAATPVAFGQYQGQELELQLPGAAILSTCDTHGPGSPFTGTAYFVFPSGFYAQGPNSRWHLYIADVDGTRLIAMISILEGAKQADITAAKAIVASFEFTP